MTDAIVLRGVTKSFGATRAVRDLELVVPRGALYGFIGPNGAGKTTTLRMILSILLPDRGSIAVLGRRSALEAKDRVGYLPEERGIYRKLKAAAFLAYIGCLKGLDQRTAKRRAAEWLERVGLASVANSRCEELSKGMQQKVGFVAAVLHEPELLVLDEPFSGLDPVSARLLRELIVDLNRRGTTILFSTHVMAQAEELCERVVMMHEGMKVLDASVSEIRGRRNPRAILFEPLDPDAGLESLRAVRGVASFAASGAGFRIELAHDVDPVVALRELVSVVPPARVELERKTLEDVFIEIVARTAAVSEKPSQRGGLDDGKRPDVGEPG
jgi:ABC-2 type transport system ATP-binding protein